VLYGDEWGTVCDDFFTDASARVVCYMLGYGYAVVSHTFFYVTADTEWHVHLV